MDEKKVGILNFHFAQNGYGAVMEGYSLTKILKKLGYSAHIINFVPPDISTEPSVFEDFRKKYLTLTGICRSWNEIKQTNDQFQTFLVGSDQIWRWHYDFIYTLGWVRGCKNFIAYAASFGTPDVNWSERNRRTFRNCIERFDSVSIREKSGVKICRERFGIEAERTLDPTLLLESEDYAELTDCGQKVNSGKEYVAYMVLDDREYKSLQESNVIADIKAKYPLIDACIDEHGNYRPFGDWLRIIKDAKYVISSSFHGCVFSIIFKKQFVAVETEARGNERIKTLFELLDLSERFYRDSSDVSLTSFEEKIDYDLLNVKLNAEKSKSLQFLAEALAKKPTPKKDITCPVNFGRILGLRFLEVRTPTQTYLSLFGVFPLIWLKFGWPLSKVKACLFGIIPLFSKKNTY